MRVQVFDAGDGDCLLLTGNGGGTILFDGGRKTTFRNNVAPELAAVAHLDLVCVSHIDNDHIQGIVELMDMRLQQIRADFHDAHPNNEGNAHTKPPSHRPPGVAEFWHNSFPALTGSSADAIGNALAAQQQIFAAVFNEEGQLLSDLETSARSLGFEVSEIRRLENLATGFFEGIELEKKIGLAISTDSVNRDFPRNLVERPGGDDLSVPNVEIGSVTLHVLSPTKSELNKFRRDWEDWVEENQGRIADLEGEIGELLTTVTSGTPRIVESARRSTLTPQNLVSIVVLVEEDGSTALFTGDAHQKDILEGLEAGGWLNQAGPDEVLAGHVNLLKVQHHGSPNNLDRDFAVRVTADHYVLCGNGAHGNPSKQVIDHIIDSRTATNGSTKRALTDETEQPFHLWFTAHPDHISSPTRKKHMEEILDHVKARILEHPTQIGATVLLDGVSLDLDPSDPVSVGTMTVS